MPKLTPTQLLLLTYLRASGDIGLTYEEICRNRAATGRTISGLLKRVLAEEHTPSDRLFRLWRITEAGRAAIESGRV